MTRQERYAYIAGIIDGDGCISIYRNTDNGWTLRICVDMQSKKVIDFLIGSFGGHCNMIAKPGVKYGIYYWYICGSKAYDMLKHIKLYLVEKKAQASLAMKFFLHQKNYGVRQLTEQETKERERYKERLTKLKTVFLTPCIALAETKCENAVMGEAIVQVS